MVAITESPTISKLSFFARLQSGSQLDCRQTHDLEGEKSGGLGPKGAFWSLIGCLCVLVKLVLGSGIFLDEMEPASLACLERPVLVVELPSP